MDTIEANRIVVQNKLSRLISISSKLPPLRVDGRLWGGEVARNEKSKEAPLSLESNNNGYLPLPMAGRGSAY